MVTASKRAYTTQVCCTQSPCPCGSPLLTQTSTEDTQTQFCLSLSGISGSWCTQGMFEPFERLCQIWSLVLNVISPFLPSCYTHLNAEFQRIARRDKKAFLRDQCKEIEQNNRMGKSRDLFKKIRDTKGTFHVDGPNKGKKWYGPNRSRRY